MTVRSGSSATRKLVPKRVLGNGLLPHDVQESPYSTTFQLIEIMKGNSWRYRRSIFISFRSGTFVLLNATGSGAVFPTAGAKANWNRDAIRGSLRDHYTILQTDDLMPSNPDASQLHDGANVIFCKQNRVLLRS